jgi:hypothetical protein
MKLKEKFQNVEICIESQLLNLKYDEYMNCVDDCVEIADDFAIGFAIWKEMQATQDENGFYYGESRIGVSRENPVDIYQLLEIYKKEKGL